MSDLSFEDLTPAERRWIETMHGRLRELRGMTLGTYAEAVVAVELDGAKHSPGGTDLWDLTWRKIKVEIKSSRNNTWKIRRASGMDDNGDTVQKLWADVWVIAVHTGTDHRRDWKFYVVPRVLLERRTTANLTRKQLHAWGLTAVEGPDLPKAIRKAHKANIQPTGPATLFP